MRWVELSVASGKDNASAIVSLLDKFSHGGTAVEDWPIDGSTDCSCVVRAYLPCDQQTGAKIDRLREGLHKLNPLLQLREHTLEPGEWLNSWKEFFPVLEIGRTLVVRPTWRRDEPILPEKVVIELDPGMAFGTGLHATTRFCLIRIEKHLLPGMSVLDLGTGTGILAIAAAKLGATSVLALDTDPVAVRIARDNVIKNGVTMAVSAKRGTLSTTAAKRLSSQFDLVVANITSRIIAQMAERLSLVLKPGGRLVVSGINEMGLDTVLIRLALADLRIDAIDHEGEWHAITAIR